MNIAKYLPCFLFVCSFIGAEERFLLIDASSGETVIEIGSGLNERVSPCSTFKIVLSLMGYDAGTLTDQDTPVWEFQEGYDDFLAAWKKPQTPQSWMGYSCVWYSKLLSCQLGLEKMQHYLAAFNYGNRELYADPVMPGKEDCAWFPSAPLAISPREQVDFIIDLLHHNLPISIHATEMTKAILFKEELSHGWKLFGKTGWSGSIGRHDPSVLEYAWFVGWIEKESCSFPFAYLIRDHKIALDQRVPRVKQLIAEIPQFTLLRE